MLKVEKPVQAMLISFITAKKTVGAMRFSSNSETELPVMARRHGALDRFSELSYLVRADQEQFRLNIKGLEPEHQNSVCDGAEQ